jgi:aspartate aminotransferase-like enzyme
MEAAVSNLTSPGDKILVLSAGKFGERWVSLGKAFHCDTVVLSKPYGQTFPIKEVQALLTPEVKAVFVQATETSTGVRHDVSALAQLTKASNALLVVDAITGLGTTTFNVDGDGIDVIIGGSQKALMIPPGLAYLAASERAWARMDTSQQPRYYFDLRKERKSCAKGESAYTPSVALIAAMGAALDYLERQGSADAQQGTGDLAKGRDLLIANAELSALCMRTAAQAMGLSLFSCSPAAAVTAIKAPEGVSSTDLVKGFKKEFAGVLSDGQGEMKGQILRIAHIGYLDYLDCIAIIAGLEQVLSQLKPDSFQLGDGLRAAQLVYAQARQNGEGK